jgi:hypothetical protein
LKPAASTTDINCIIVAIANAASTNYYLQQKRMQHQPLQPHRGFSGYIMVVAGF